MGGGNSKVGTDYFTLGTYYAQNTSLIRQHQQYVNVNNVVYRGYRVLTRLAALKIHHQQRPSGKRTSCCNGSV